MMIKWIPMTTVLPEGKIGEAELRHLVVDEQSESYSRIRVIATGNFREEVHQGVYAGLFVKNKLVMSDTQTEKRDNVGFIVHAKGDVLVAGLGLGMVLFPVITKSDVKSVTVIEKSADVISLIESPLRKALGKREKLLQIIHSDIFTWKPPKNKKWDTIYFDIWPDLCTDYLPEMTRLHRRYARRKSPGGWMSSWNKGYLQYRRSQERRMGW
jgi:spermidine synthase